MPIMFPRELPAVRYAAGADPVLDDGVTASRTRGRLTSFSQVVDPTWSVTLSTLGLVYSQFTEVEAWWLSLRGGTASKGVIFRHPHMRYPLAHVANPAPAEINGRLVTVTEGNLLNVADVAPGLILSIGDVVGLQSGAQTYRGKITEVSGVGSSRSIRVEPPPYRAVAQIDAVVRFANIPLMMRPVPGSFSAPRSGRFYTVSFKLQE